MAGEGLGRLRRALGTVRAGARLFLHAGLDERVNARSLVSGLRTARDMRRLGLRMTAAVLHLHALMDPERPALVGPGHRLSFGELEQRVFSLSHGLRALGLGPGERMAMMLRNSVEHVETVAALALTGAAAVQVGYRLKAAEVAYILDNAKPRALLFHADLQPVIEEALTLAREAPLVRERCLAVGDAPGFRRYHDLLAGGDPHRPTHVPGGGYGGVMIYTSGTTGRAKGAARDLGRMGLEPVLDFMARVPLRHDERHLVVCPLYHSMAPAFVSMVASVGGCSVLLEQFEPEVVLRTIEHERITSSLMVPTMLSRLLALPGEVRRRYDTSSLRWLMTGAAPLPTELARQVEAAFGPILYNFYGATETGLVTLALPGEHTARPGTIGRLVGGNEARLLDADGREVGDGEVGELYVKNPMLMDEYFANPAATREVARDGFISVGDLATRDADGYFYLVDRKSDMVISGGVNIYPWEIEQRLHEHPAVLEAAVIGIPDGEWGESLAAFVVLRPGVLAAPDELGEWVRQALADFKRPRVIELVDALPRNPTGKVLKRELRARWQAAHGPAPVAR